MSKTNDDDLINLLKGVDRNLKQETIFTCNTEREQQNDVLIAKGHLPTPDNRSIIESAAPLL